MANLCCPEGYYFNGTGCCANGSVCSNISQTIPTIACDCCPEGSTYINSLGQYSDPIWGTSTIANPDISTYANTCAQLVNIGGGRGGWAIATGGSTSTCPCCPEGYTYASSNGMCVGLKPTDLAPTIPCIPCICQDPPPPPDCETCNEQGGLPIAFAFNPFTKQCTDCVAQGFQLTKDHKLNAFMPYFLILPNTNGFNQE